MKLLLGHLLVKKDRFRCCVNGTDMDACDFSIEDSQCAQYEVRNAH